MARYANQKTYRIHREIPKGSKRQFLSIYTDNLVYASRTLSATGFKLYLYLASNQDNYTKDYSPKDFSNVYGVSYESARTAPQNLVDNGFLVEEGGMYHFYEVPQETLPTHSFKEKRRSFTDETTGEILSLTFSELKAACPELDIEEIKALWADAMEVE